MLIGWPHPGYQQTAGTFSTLQIGNWMHVDCANVRMGEYLQFLPWIKRFTQNKKKKIQQQFIVGESFLKKKPGLRIIVKSAVR